MDAARRGRRHRGDVVAAVGAAHGGTLDRPIGLQVVERHHAAGLFDGGDDLPGERDLDRKRPVRRPRSLRAKPQARPAPAVSPRASGVPSRLRKICAAAGQRARRGCARGSESARSSSTAKPSRASANRRRDQLRERELARAVALMREREPRDRAGHADAERRFARLLRVGLAFLVEEHVARQRGGRGLAIVDRDRLVAAARCTSMKPPPPILPACGCVTAIAKPTATAASTALPPCAQDLHADAGCVLLLRRHHAVAGDHGKKARLVGDDRRGRGRRGLAESRACGERHDQKTQEPSHGLLHALYSSA